MEEWTCIMEEWRVFAIFHGDSYCDLTIFFNGHSMGFIVRYQEDRMGMSWNIHVCINNYPSGKSPCLMGKLTINHHFQ